MGPEKPTTEGPARAHDESGSSPTSSSSPIVSSGPILDAPFNGVMQPVDPKVLDQGALLDQVSVDLPDEEPSFSKKRFSRKRFFGLSLLLFGCIVAILLGIRIEANKTKAQEASLASPSARFQQQQVPLTTLGKRLGTASTTTTGNAVTINGSLVLTPSVQPSAPIPGQLYYDRASHQVQYYDGTGYIHLQGGNVVTNNTYDNTTVNNTYGGGTTVNNFYSTTTSNPVTNDTYITNNISNGASIQGTAGALAMFGATGTTLADSLIKQSGSTVNVATTGTNTVNVGSGGGASITNLQGGTGGVNISTGTVNGTSGNIVVNGGMGSLTMDAGEVNIASLDQVNIASGAGSATITTGAATGTSANISIESGASSSTASGNVTIDTGSNFVTGTVVQNNTFEDGIDGINPWVGGTTSAQNCTIAHTGSCSLATTGPNFWGLLQNNNVLVPITAGHHYFISMWVRAATGGDKLTGALIWNVGGFNVNYLAFPAVTTTTTGWTQVTASGIAPAGATTGQFRIGAALPNQDSNGIQYVDDLTVTDLSSGSAASELDLGDTNAQLISIGNMNEVGPTTIDGGSGINMNAGAASININGGAITVAGTAASSFGTDSGSLTLGAGGGTGGGVIVKPQNASTTAFQVQGIGVNLLTIDSTDGAVSLGIGAGSSFGNTHVGSNVGSAIPAGTLAGYKFTTTAAGTLVGISVNIGVGQLTSPNNHYQLAVYADNSGAPGTYLGSTAIGSLSADGWNSLPLTAPLNVLANTSYWLVYWGNGSDTITYTTGFPSAVAAGSASTWQAGPDNGMPATFPAGSTSTGSLYSIYASYSSTLPALTVNSLGTLTQNGAALFQDPTDSTDALQVQDNLGNNILTVDTADGQVDVPNLDVSGHIITSGTSPGITSGAAACTTPTVGISGDDTSGTVTITTGTGCSGGGTLATITFANAFSNAPNVTLTPANAVASTLQYYNGNSGDTTFTVDTNNSPAGSTTYKWHYLVTQ